MGLVQMQSIVTVLLASVLGACSIRYENVRPKLIKAIPFALIPILNPLYVHCKTTSQLMKQVEENVMSEELKSSMKKFKKEDIKTCTEDSLLLRVVDFLPMMNCWQNDIATILKLLGQAEKNSTEGNRGDLHTFIVAGGYHNHRIDFELERSFGYRKIAHADVETDLDIKNFFHRNIRMRLP